MTKLGLADKYEGVTEPSGEIELTEALGDDNPRPFKCYLDSGLKRTSTGSRIFGALKVEAHGDAGQQKGARAGAHDELIQHGAKHEQERIKVVERGIEGEVFA